MAQIETRDDRPKLPPDDVPADQPPQGAGALYRQHLARFPERGTDSTLERAAKALIRAAQFHRKAPRRAD